MLFRSDGQNVHKAELARAQYRSALHLFPPAKSGWTPRVETCSSINFSGIDIVWDMILEFVNHTKNNSYFDIHRKEQSQYWMYETINEKLKQSFYQNNNLKDKINEYESKVLNDEISSFEAAKKLLNIYFNKEN